MRKLVALTIFATIFCVSNVVSANADKLPVDTVTFVIKSHSNAGEMPVLIAFEKPETPSEKLFAKAEKTKGYKPVVEPHCNSPG